MRAKKLPSGSWRCRATRNGITKSFTVKDKSPQGRRTCEQMASAWAYSVSKGAEEKTVKDLIAEYIDKREKVLSPSTISAYRSMLRNAFENIDYPSGKVTDSDVQAWIDGLSTDHSPKYVSNVFALFTASVGKYNAKLPARKKYINLVPTDEDIERILDRVKGRDMEKAVLLAAFGTLREGEVCALRVSDIEGTVVNVRRSLAWNGEGYTEKLPKTAESVRSVYLSENIIERILKDSDEDGRIVHYTPKNLSNAFAKLMKRMDMPYHFHSLRVYSASVRHSLAIPDAYIMSDGGWRTDSVLKSVYRKAMDDKRKEFSDVATEHFDRIVARNVAIN